MLAKRTAGGGPRPYEHHHHDVLLDFPLDSTG